MQALAAVAEALSFTKAAIRLGRDATVLSRRVQSLERRLGVRLLERTTRSVMLTEAGRRYLAGAQAALHAIEETERDAMIFGTGEPRGRLRLALPGSFGRLWLSQAIAEFLLAYPQVTIEAEFSNRFVDVIGEGFDLAVRLGELTDSRLMARKIGERRRLICAAPSYLVRAGTPTHPDELASHACLVFTGLPTPARWDLRDRLGRTTRVAVSGPIVSDEAEVLLDAASAGLGVLMTTDWMVGRAIADGRLVPILEDWALVDEGAIYIVTPSGSHGTSKARAFSDWIAARFQRPPWLTPGATAS